MLLCSRLIINGITSPLWALLLKKKNQLSRPQKNERRKKLADMRKKVSSVGLEREKRARPSVIYRFSCALEAKFVCWLKEKQHHRKDLSSGAQRTDGGGEPRPIRGTFSYRGVPPKRAAWFLGRKGRPGSDAGGKASNANTLCSVLLTCSRMRGRWRRAARAVGGCSGCPCCCCSCRSCARW